ncbi:MAG: DUF4956 domain-containing protein, partial [Candidatus Saccharibacteria bacterium]
YSELLATNIMIVGGLYILEKILNLRQEMSQRIIYEKIENLHADRTEELMADLILRTGLTIKRIEVDRIDFLRDTARILIYYDVNGTKKL